jgi:hypothetical protein
VHGGAVAALFYRLALPRPPVRLRLHLPRGVPTGTRLDLTTGSAGREARLALAQGERRLAEAALLRDPGPPPGREALAGLWPGAGAPAGATDGHPEEGGGMVPRTRTCLACGLANPLSAGVHLAYDPRRVFCEYDPLPAYAGPAGSPHPALASILLDELGWWLGALRLAECGVTTELDLTMWRDLPAGPLRLVGDRSVAVPAEDDARGRFVRAEGYLLSSDGDPVAHAAVRFAGSPAYTRRLLGPFLETTDILSLQRLFPRARPPG